MPNFHKVYAKQSDHNINHRIESGNAISVPQPNMFGSFLKKTQKEMLNA